MINILDLPMGENDANALNIREYLKALLYNVWNEGERFSGKRPFGNSGWEHDLYMPLVAAGLIGDITSEEERQKANDIIFDAIEALN